VPVGRDCFEFLLKCCVGEEDPVLLLHCSLYFVMVPSPVGHCGGEVGLMTDETLVCAPSGRCLFSL
jgi:hypothetical protein